MRYEHNHLKKLIKEIYYHTVVAKDTGKKRDANHSTTPSLVGTTDKYNSVRRYKSAKFKE